ncbi:DUF4367 domain-containing protein [Anaerotruncus massiliensis (ex Liu et al. 2021)]|uniref:DUF4367 domain-containing protein n=1 Tax=Anaerotruncus massiliensis (ex Liu et al. 2021) TaxID=2321404 RepID=UPI003AB2517F
MYAELPEALLREALEMETGARMAAFPEPPAHDFSRRFQRRMRRLMREADRPRALRVAVRGTRRAAALLLATAVVGMAAVMSVDALRTRFFDILIETYQKYSQVFFQKDAGYVRPEEFLYREPAYIPDGFELVFSEYIEGVALEYEDGEGGSISYLQSWQSGTGIQLNTEGVELEETEVNGWPGYYYSNKGTQSMLWYDDYYVYQILSSLDKDEVEKIAKSTKLKNS